MSETDALDFSLADRRLAEAGAAGLLDSGEVQRARIVAKMYGGGRTSGQALADSLLVSRAAVHKHVEHLRRAGFSISSQPGAGYVLDPPTDLLLPEAFLPRHLAVPGGPGENRWHTLGCERVEQIPPDLCRPGFPYHYLPTVGSTNDVLKQLAQKGAPTGTTAVTDYQAAGRGRLGRQWISREGLDLTFSLLLRPHAEPRLLRLVVLAAGTAVAETLAALPGLSGEVGLKWPNDVLVRGRKVCGLLSEASLDMDEIHWAVVGVGINVNGGLAHSVVVPEGAPPAGTLAEVSGSSIPRAPLLSRLLLRLEERIGQTLEGGQAEIIAAFREYDVLYGRRVLVKQGNASEAEVSDGVVEGIGGDGELLLRTSRGTVSLPFGEATVLPETETGKPRGA